MLATLTQRLWSSLIDVLVYLAWICLAAFLEPWPEGAHGAIKVAIWFSPPLFIEPLSIRWLGATPGQRLLGLRVLSTSDQKLTFPRLAARHVCKALLLGLSLFYLPFSARHQALHDALFGTYVVSEPLPRAFQLPDPGPILWRPFLSSLPLAWLAGILALIPLIVVFAFVPQGLDPGSPGEALFDFAASIVSSVVFIRIMMRRGRRARLNSAA